MGFGSHFCFSLIVVVVFVFKSKDEIESVSKLPIAIRKCKLTNNNKTHVISTDLRAILGVQNCDDFKMR